MIKAILPVPNRIYTPGSMILGETSEDTWDGMGIQDTWTYGRNIHVPPLAFYVVYSIWNGYLITHTFITDETFDPRCLQIHRDIYTGGVYSTPPVLVPISATYGKPGCITETFLFTQSIDFLLSNYVLGMKISDSTGITLPTARPIYPNTPDRIPIGNYRGLCGIVEYMDVLLQIVSNTRMDSDFVRWCPNELAFSIRQKVTPERPATVVNLLKDMVFYEKNQDGLFTMVDELIGLSAKEDPRCLIDEFMFRGQYDPVTIACLNTPSYLTLDVLLPYLEDRNLACGYFDIACTDVYLSEGNSYTPLMDQISGLDEGIDFDEFIEFFCHVPYTDVTVRLSRDQQEPEIYTYDRFGVYQNTGMVFGPLIDQLRKIFLSWKTSIQKYTEVTLSKTWLGEILITAVRGSLVERYYVNLNLYHLITPSLVNRERLESVIFSTNRGYTL